MKQVAPPNYTQIPNEIIDKWMRDLSGLQFKILMAICRKTFGWHKQSDKISMSQLEEITGSSWRRMFGPIKDLEKAGIIMVSRAAGKVSEFSVNISVAEEQPYDKMSGDSMTKGQGYPMTKCHPQKKLSKETTQKKEEGVEAEASPSRKRIPPSIQDVKDYMAKKGITGFTAEKFVDHYTSVGWYRGKTKITDWQACVRTWDGKANGTKSGLSLEERLEMGRKRRDAIWGS